MSGQVNSFTLNCGIPLKVLYQKNLDNSVNFNFNYVDSRSETLINDLPNQKDLNNKNNKQILISILNDKYSQVHQVNQLEILVYDNTIKKVDYKLNLDFSKDNIFIAKNQGTQIDFIYDNLNSLFSHYSIPFNCTKAYFKTTILNEISTLENKILNSFTTTNATYNNPKIKKIDNYKEEYYRDIRNPISFTSFLIRNPRINGKSEIVIPINSSSYNYIRPGSIINILFLNDVLTNLKEPQLSVEAYLKRTDGTIIPININGFFEVELNSNQNTVEHTTTNKLLESAVLEGESGFTLNYDYKITPTSNYPIQSEINPNPLNPQIGEKIFITIINNSDNNSSFSMIFEFEDFGWTGQADGGFSWVNTINSGNHDFVAGGSSSYNFYYKHNKGDRFFKKFITPSFGPELLVLQDSAQKTLVGLGANIAVFMRTFRVGYGWYLNGNNGKPYVSIGVNFVEGYKSISSILNNVKGE